MLYDAMSSEHLNRNVNLYKNLTANPSVRFFTLGFSSGVLLKLLTLFIFIFIVINYYSWLLNILAET